MKTVMTSTVMLQLLLLIYLHRLMRTLECVINNSGAQSCYCSSRTQNSLYLPQAGFGNVRHCRILSSVFLDTDHSVRSVMTKEPL